MMVASSRAISDSWPFSKREFERKSKERRVNLEGFINRPAYLSVVYRSHFLITSATKYPVITFGYSDRIITFCSFLSGLMAVSLCARFPKKR